MSGRGWMAAVAALLAAGCGAGEPPAAGAAAERRDAPAEPPPAVQAEALPDSSGFASLPDAAPALTPGAAAAADTPAADTLPGVWTAGVVERRRPGGGGGTLTEVRTARNDGFDRIVLQLSGSELPGYRVEYVDRPVRQCGSGETVEIAGDGWLSIRLEPARMHDDRGRPTIEDRARTPRLPVLLELVATCDFEGQVEWVAGVASPNRFRVLELRDPARIVVDIRQ